MKFLWSDAWILQAIAIAAQSAPARLADIIAAADAVNHALPTEDELHGALLRLTDAGFIEEVAERFRLTTRLPKPIRARIVGAGLERGRAAASAFLDAEPWSRHTNVGDPRNNVTYPGLTSARIGVAEREYFRRSRH